MARSLIGCTLVCGSHRGVISETEAYMGPHDLACHSRVGRTKRTEVMFGPPGHAYIYLIYGMYWCLNVVTGNGAAVLIRSAHREVSHDSQRHREVSHDSQRTDGPGRLTRAFGIDKRFNGHDLTVGEGLWIEAGEKRRRRILVTPRIGIAYAGEWAAKPLRYVLAPNVLGSR